MQTLKISPQAAQTLERVFGPDLDRSAVEALAIEGYRTAKLTAGEVAKVLGLETSIEAYAWLGRHGVGVNYSLEDLAEDRATLDRMLPKALR